MLVVTLSLCMAIGDCGLFGVGTAAGYCIYCGLVRTGLHEEGIRINVHCISIGSTIDGRGLIFMM